jgi:hypothetical protein
MVGFPLWKNTSSKISVGPLKQIAINHQQLINFVITNENKVKYLLFLLKMVIIHLTFHMDSGISAVERQDTSHLTHLSHCKLHVSLRFNYR